MLKRFTSASTALLFSVQSWLMIVPASSQWAAPNKSRELGPESAGGEIAVLEAQHPALSVGGLKVLLKESHYADRVLVHVTCVGPGDTPSLAVNRKIYGANARLLNLTTTPEHQCASYRIASAALDAHPVLTTSLTSDSANEALAVSLHHAGVRPSEALKYPSVFVFNPVHGNWTEAKPFVPSAPEPQRVYATLSKENEQIIGGVIALPESLQTEPARSNPLSLAKPLEQVNPLSGYLGIDKIEPDSKGAYAVNLPLLLRPSRGPGPSFAMRFSSQGLPGVLGRGWDLIVSSIDVRGPAPVFHPAYETEDYVLDGMDLIPLDGSGKDIPSLYKGGPIIPRVSELRTFRLRNNSDGLIIRRYGNAPDSYFWEVWDPNRHVTRLYGGSFKDNDSPPVSAGENGILKGTVPFGDGSPRSVIGQWGLTAEFDSQPARNGALYTYAQVLVPGADRCASSWDGACTPALRLREVEYNRAFATNAPTTGVTDVRFQWEPREPNRFNSDARLGFLRAHEYLLKEMVVYYQPEPGNVWLAAAATGDDQLNGKVLFARHRFDVSNGEDACMNFDQVLTGYTVETNPLYDGGNTPRNGLEGEIPLSTQTFNFTYEGQKNCERGSSESVWPSPTDFGSLGELLKKAPGGQLGFPTGLLDHLGFGLLTSGSLLGTSRSEETGASLYVGFGPPGPPNTKELTGGFKAGVNFTRSEGNSTLVDITGDGIDDIVFREGGQLKYCAGRRAPLSENGVYNIEYPAERCGSIEGLSDFAVSSSDTKSVGAEYYPFFSAFAGVAFNSSQNESYVYFADRDGDGLVDIVNYGRVLYNQGETREGGKNIVRFTPRSALIPPVPGKVSDASLTARFPTDMRDTITAIEAKLEATSRALRTLEFSQTVLAWEAPLAGSVTLSGSLVRGASTPEADNAGPFGPQFGPAEFDAMKDKVAAYQNYISDKYNCVFWTAEEQCHAESSDPLGPHYSRRLRDISFIDAPPAIAKLWIYRRSTRSLEACGDKPLNGTLDLATVLDPARCRRSDDPAGEIRVDTGDVIYLGYKIHPHLAAWLKPAVKIAYMSVDGDAAFNLFKSGSTVPEALPCRWKDQIRAAERADCLLARQTRYEYELGTGLLPTAPGAAAILPPGSNRSFGGRLEIPADFLHEYQIYFDVMGEARDEPAPGTPVPSSPPPGARAPILTAASSLPRLFRQDITNQCAATTGTCVLNIAPACAPAAPITDCATFSDPTRPLVLASRITVLHRVSGVELPVRNISQRLADLHWRVPPHVRSELTEKQANAPVPGRILYVPTNASKITVLHLPVAMGEPDLEYVRVEQGRFDNPDTTLDDGDARPDEIFFQEFVDNEPDNVLLTRIRQTLALCAFAEEVRDFISARFSTNVSPYPDDYLQYWRTKVAQHEARCDQAKDRFKAYSFTSRNPETSSRNTLRLPFFLRNLPFAEQITSAETLLERVLNNLALGEALLTDAPRLSRRGYRLPVNVNPFDCEVLNKGTSIIEPVSVPKGDCAYRLSANFAMQEFEEVVARELSKELREKTIKNMRDVLARFQNSHNPAFRIDLMATANGRPVAFTQLSGELSGNDPCTSTAPNTCMGMYGSRAADSAEIAEHFYPKRRNGQPGDRHGDVFQRITLNKRTGRTVAFSNAVMLSGETQFCPRPPHFGAYPDIGAMELKQDCPIPDSAKYIGSPRYVISYTIGENNQFDGRNRVFEFRAKPLDVLELHIRLSPIDEIIPRNAANPIDTITGKFSVFDGSAAPPVGIARTRYMIPRAASQILTPSDGPADSDVQSLICPQIPDPPGSGAAPLPVTCRPWTRLGWTEILLGAQYRTYSDAQKAGPGDNRFSVLRRRDMLRLHPEIEVKAEEFALAPPSGEFPRLDAVKQETHLAFYSRDPNVWKTGGDWALFGGKGEGRALRQPLNFNIPQKDSLRYGDWAAPAGGYDLKVYERANDACGPAGAPNYDGCENHLGRQGTAVLTLKNVVWFPLEHQFIGPAIGAAYDKALLENPTRPQTGVCAAEAPNAIASCWKGVDDTVFLERAVSAATVDPAPYSVSALVGFERPPIVQFLFEFESYRRLACIDPQSPSGAAGVCPSSLSGTPEAAEFPNRPIPPSRAIEVFAPVQSSRSQSVSHNEGLALFNTDHIDTRLVTTRQFRDVNGDGYPDVISNGTVELTSPVGLSRRDWWTYFRITDSIGEFGSGLSGSNFDQGNNSVSGGAGIGLSANTAAKFQPRATKTKTSGSTDAAVDPGFDLSIERGYDESFVELRDFNGDGIADKLSGGTIGAGLRVQFNAGNTLGAKLLDPVKVRGGSVDGYHFNTSHSAGFGVRLGFSYGAGSFLAGMGLSHRDGGSQAALIDFTGDGRPDIVVPADGGLLVFPNLGNGFGPGRLHRLTDWNQRPQVGTESGTTMSETTLVDAGTAFTYGFTTIFFKMVFTPGIKWTHNQTRELLNIRDINGDGVPDVVTVSGSFLPAPGGTPTLDPASLATRVHYNPNGKYHMLAGITNPSGSRWVLRHALLGNSGPENGRPVWALTGVARYDGYVPERWDPALPPDGHDVLLTTYSYAQGYYNRAERQFYGFASRTSRNYGCNTTTIDAGSCLRLVEAVAEPDWPVLSASGYRKLQVVHQTFSNRDFLTQGLELSRTVAGATSTPDELDNVEPPVEAVSRDLVAYTVDDLQTLTGEFAGQCAALNRTPIADSWNASSFSVDRSALAPTWEGSTPFPRERGLLGSGGVCGSNLKDCAETLRQATCDAGFVREQRAFWAQQSGSVRRRLITLQSFGGGVPVGEPALLLDTVSPRLHSAVAFDHDQWGQVVGFNSVGEANSDWNPQQDASTNAIISYAPRQGLNAVRQAGGVGYPMLALAQDLQIFGGPWREADSQSPPLRAREALYSDNRREGNKWKAVNRSDVCVYPGGEGFRFTSGICAAFKRNMRDALGDGYSTIQDALRSAYAKTTGLPKGETSFDAIVHHQLTDYDAFGNLLHAISPISRNKEWIERRFDYAGDPFRRTPTTLTLTRCVNDVPGAGTDGPNVERLPPDERPRCTFGLDTLPDPILRKPITHRSQNRIDSHFGSVAESRDLNENRLLFDFDRWGRLSLLARAWGNAPRENRTLQGRVKRAIAKDPANAYAADTVPLAESEKWHVLSAIDYEKIADGLLRSNVRRFESSDSYSGLLGNGQTTRETAMFADGLGRLIQSIRETDVCVGVDDDFMVQGRNTKMPAAGLADRCTAVATGVVTPGTRIDALGRDIETFEPYPISHIPPREGSWRRFENLEPPPAPLAPLVSTSYDGAGRPLLVESRLSRPKMPNIVQGSAQYRYRVLPQDGDRLPRFEALSLSPRCTASAVWSDARGLRRMVFEDQEQFYPAGSKLPMGTPPIGQNYQRNDALTRGFCASIESIANQWTAAARQAAISSGGQPARVNYAYDPLQQLTGVDSPLAGPDRARIAVRFDLLGRMREMQEPNSGCTRYEYDGLNALISETGFRHEEDAETPCGTTTKVRTQKSYDYAAGRMVRMSYRSLEEQGAPPDERDSVRIFYDRSPSAILFGTPLEALRFVPNDQANQRFIETAGRACDNCIGQATVITDRTGARAYSFNELGLARREVRSIVAPVREVQHSKGLSETYLPEVAFYEVESAYTAFGDPVQERFSESAPINPANACFSEGVNTCLSRFTIGRKYAPDGALAQLIFNNRPLISAAQDAFGRPAMRWTKSGIATGYRYDERDLRLNRMTTLTASYAGGISFPVQFDAYQYDGGGNILDYSNRPLAADYESAFSFEYDAVNRLTGFRGAGRRGDGGSGNEMTSAGEYAYDAGHRFKARSLTISGGTPASFQRRWRYTYGSDPRDGPVHAPRSIGFAIDDAGLRDTILGYDDLGRMTRMRAVSEGSEPATGLLSNRAMTWDAEGRLIRVRGVRDGALPLNERALREDYVYDRGGNRTLKIDRPWVRDENDSKEKEGEAATLYLTPFYARPYDRRGTVQLAHGSLPAVGLAAPADVSEDPFATYIYSDLPAGSMTVAVTVFGEPTDINAIVTGRREYSPYGLELTTDGPATTGRGGSPPLSVFHGKELDRLTNFSSFGARYYSRDLGMWLKPDPNLARRFAASEGPNTSDLSSYSFVRHRPTAAIDPDGNDAMVVVFPDYLITVGEKHIPYLGHAGVVIINSDTGATKYYEYGRYDRGQIGVVRLKQVPNLIMEAGQPTAQSMRHLMQALANIGHGSKVAATYDKGAVDYTAMVAHAEQRLAQNTDAKRTPYGVCYHNCYSFAEEVAASGRTGLLGMLANLPSPRDLFPDVPTLKSGSDLTYDPKTGKLGGGMLYTLPDRKDEDRLRLTAPP